MIQSGVDVLMKVLRTDRILKLRPGQHFISTVAHEFG